MGAPEKKEHQGLYVGTDERPAYYEYPASSLKKTEPIKEDPFESFNRYLFFAGDRIDYYFLRPAAIVYYEDIPSMPRQIFRNFNQNIAEIYTITNGLFILDIKRSSKSFLRLLINSTLGALGLFDVASKMKIGHEKIMFEDVLKAYGMPAGPYVTIGPMPGDVRSTLGLVGELVLRFFLFEFWVLPYMSDSVYFSYLFFKTLDLRSEVLPYEEMVSYERYAFMRNTYINQRRTFDSDSDPFLEEDF